MKTKISGGRYDFTREWCVGFSLNREALVGRRVYCLTVNYGRGCAYVTVRR